MKNIQHSSFLLALIVLTGFVPVQATGQVFITHDSWWRISGRELTIHVNRISNTGTADSPPLFASIYTQPNTPYDGGPPGRLLARAPLGSIAAGSDAVDVTLTARIRGAAGGLKYSTLVIEEQNGRKFNVLDYVAYYSSYSFPRKQAGGVGSEDGAIGRGNDVAVPGASSLTRTGRRAVFSVEKIQSRREFDATGMLRLAIYATPEPYTGDGAATVVGTRVLGQLAPGDYYTALSGTIPLKRVRRVATQYLTLVVEEEGDSGFAPVAYVTALDPGQL